MVARRRIGGRADEGAEQHQVAAVVERRQRGRGRARLGDHGSVGDREHVHRRAQRVEPLGEALHAQVEQLLGLLAAYARRLACARVHVDPAARIAIERVRHAGERRVRARPGRLERASHLRPPVRVPHAVKLLLRALAEQRSLVPDAAVHHHERRGDRHRAGDRHPATAARGRIPRQLGQQRRHRRPALGRIRRQAPQDDLPEPARNVAVGRRRLHPPAELLPHQPRLSGRLALARSLRADRRCVDLAERPRVEERALAVEALVERQAEAVLVRARVDRASHVLLRRHIRSRADDVHRVAIERARPQRDRGVRAIERRVGCRIVHRPRWPDRRRRAHRAHRALVRVGRKLRSRCRVGARVCGQRRHRLRSRRGRLGCDREAEVEHHHPSVLAEVDVVGLEVAMHQAGLVRRLEAATRRPIAREDVAERAPRLFLPGPQRLPPDVLHRDVDLLVLDGPDFIYVDHVRVRQAGQRPGLAQQSTARHRIDIAALAGTQQLQRDLAVQDRIVRRMDHAHAAASQPPQQDVPAAALQLFERPGCRSIGAVRRCEQSGIAAPRLHGFVVIPCVQPRLLARSYNEYVRYHLSLTMARRGRALM